MVKKVKTYQKIECHWFFYLLLFNYTIAVQCLLDRGARGGFGKKKNPR